MKKIFLVSLAILSFTQFVVGQTTEDDLSKVKSDISKVEDVEEVPAEDESDETKEAEEALPEDASSDEKIVEEELDDMEDPEAIIDLDRLEGVSGKENAEKENQFH